MLNVHLGPARAKDTPGDLHIIGGEGILHANRRHRYFAVVVDAGGISAEGGHRDVCRTAVNAIGLSLGRRIVVVEGDTQSVSNVPLDIKADAIPGVLRRIDSRRHGPVRLVVGLGVNERRDDWAV